MCFVSYVPTQTGFYFSSNRDESPLRDAEHIVEEVVGSETLFFPKDNKGGSWIFISDRGRITCILNGAFEFHKSTPPYKMSRGIMCKKYYLYENSIDFFERFDFWEMEPFTMIIYEDSQAFYEMRWDGSKKYLTQLDSNKKQCWSSATLYNANERRRRKELFLDQLLNSHQLEPTTLRNAHLIKSSRNDKEDGILINRDNIVRTISHTQIAYTQATIKLTYDNLLAGHVEKVSI